MAFYGKPITYRTTDFKSNEYRNLLGGSLFEHTEDNPMLGYRGVSRNIHDWEIEAFKLARGVYGGSNLRMPPCTTGTLAVRLPILSAGKDIARPPSCP